MQDSPRILVISYYFPPFNRVGGRRWAKHAKYLHRMGVPVYVLAGRFGGSSPWDKDVKPLESRITRIDRREPATPFHKRKLPSGFAEKLRWKCAYYSWELLKRFKKGNFLDASRGSENDFFEKASEIIQHKNIDTVILSTGPFAYSRILPALKKKFPSLKTVLDYRDYWEDVFDGLSAKQVSDEASAQQKVINDTDLILSPNREMRDHYAARFSKPSYLLPHCIDPEDLPPPAHTAGNGTVRLIYGGAFYKHIEDSIVLMSRFIDAMSGSMPVTAEFYVSTKGYERELSHPSVTRFGFTDAQRYFDKVAAADFVILVLPPNRVNAMSSKFFELLASRKPILYFGGEGDVSRFISRHRLGFHITAHNLAEQVARCIRNLDTQEVPDRTYDIGVHTFEYQTKKLLQQLTQ